MGSSACGNLNLPIDMLVRYHSILLKLDTDLVGEERKIESVPEGSCVLNRNRYPGTSVRSCKYGLKFILVSTPQQHLPNDQYLDVHSD